MTKTPLQFRHNGRDVAMFVEFSGNDLALEYMNFRVAAVAHGKAKPGAEIDHFATQAREFFLKWGLEDEACVVGSNRNRFR